MKRSMGIPDQRTFFSLTASMMVILSTLSIGVTLQIPNVTAAALTHDVGNLDIESLTDFGRILEAMYWKSIPQTTDDPGTQIGFIGLVIDQDNYNHPAGSEQVADPFKTWPYIATDDFTKDSDIHWIINNGTTQNSAGSFHNTGAGTGDPDDIRIEQTAWTVLNKDWAILQWRLINLKTVPITGVCIGLELPLSQVGANYGVGWDSGDDIDGFDSGNDVYWVQDDNGAGTCIGFGSVLVSDPITHYYSQDYHPTTYDEYKLFWENDTWLYNRLHAPNGFEGSTTPGNRTSTVGWDGFTIDVGSFRTVTLVIAINNTYDSMITALKDARYFHQSIAASIVLTEFSDSGGSHQIEVYNNGREPTPVSTIEFSVDGGSTFLTGSWDKDPIPTYEYAVFSVSGGTIGAQGDTISIYENNKFIEEVAFGQEGVAPDPLPFPLESVARRYDVSTDRYTNEWLRNGSSGPTFGSQNDVGSIISIPIIVINRVMFNPIDPLESYVGLMYQGTSDLGVDISGYKIVCNDEIIVPSGTTNLNRTNKFFVLTYSDFPAFFNNMITGGDNVYLYNQFGYLMDMVGWSSPHTPGYYMSRIPDGNGTYQGFNDTTSQSAGWVFDLSPSLMLTEFYTDSGAVQIELYNPRGGDIVLSPRWTLDVGGVLTGNWNNDPITWKGYSIFTMTGGSPGDEGDTISLYYQGSNLIDQVSYGTSGVAPDPLLGESTARYWDISIPGYTGDWTRNASSGPTWGGQNDVLPIETAPSIMLNEVMFNPSVIPDGRFIVIINNQGFVIDVSNYYLVCDEFYQLPTMDLPPFTMLLIDYMNAPSLFNSMNPTGDNVYLYDSNGLLLDMVGWNTPHTQEMSVRRVPDGFGTYQGYNDITSQAAGWVFNSPLQVLMTEISDDGSTQAQIEVYNPWYSMIDFGVGFTFESDSTPPGSLTGLWWIQTANSGEYAVFNVTTGLDPEGDTISFYQNGVLIEKISYGQKGTVPDPLQDESVERYWDGSAYTNMWERNRTSGPNFGTQNDVPQDNLSSSVILNEVFFNPNAVDDHFVEIYNRGTIPIDISGYKLVCNTEYIIPDGIRIEFDNFFYLLYGMDNAFFDNMLSPGDNVYLYDANGSLIDMVGWDSPHTVDMTISRIPYGNGTRDGYDDVSSIAAGWRFDQTPSISLVQIGPDTQQYCQKGEIVAYYLNISNIDYNKDYVVDISNVTGPWGWEVITQNVSGDPLYDSNGNGIPDIFVPAGGRVFIIVIVKVPTSASPGDNETTIITVKSAFNPFFVDSAILTTRVKTIQAVTFPEGSFVIPMDDKQNDVLKAFGFVHALLRNGTSIYRIIEPPDIDISTNLYPFSDIFAGGPILVMPSDISIVNAVHSNFPSVTIDITIKSFTSDKVDVIFNPTNILLIYGISGHTQDVLTDMEIPFTMVYTLDVENNPNMLFNYDLIIDDCPGWGGSVPSTVTNNMQIIAEQGGELIFTCIALRDLDAVFPGHIPVTRNFGGTWPCSVYRIPEFPGQYYGPPTLDIYTMGGGQIMMAPTDPNVRIMVDCHDYGGQYRVLAAYFYNGSGINSGGVVEGFGYHPGDQPPDARILASIFFGNKFVHLPPPPVIPDIIPPTLYIKTVGDDIILNWTQPTTEGLSHYLIYRSTSQIGFDFSNAWVNTSLHNDSGIIPLRTTWNDTGAASGNAPQEYYYVIRTVFESNEISHTSRTVGKWTKKFPKGVSTFSLPLKPLKNMTIDYCLNDMNPRYIKWMNLTTHIWMKHGDSGVNDTQMKLGEGYEVKLDSQTNYTFTGMPGAMIHFDDNIGFLGFDTTEAKSLVVSVDASGNINLSWQEPASMGIGDKYEVYYSNTRDGFFGTSGIHYKPACPPIDFRTNTTTITGLGANIPGSRLYIMVVPFNASGIRGASTYSIGIWTEEYLPMFDTFGLPLKLNNNETADWYCNEIPDTVGINYYINREQRWCWHSIRMPAGAYDPVLEMTGGYQISTSGATKFTFIGV